MVQQLSGISFFFFFYLFFLFKPTFTFLSTFVDLFQLVLLVDLLIWVKSKAIIFPSPKSILFLRGLTLALMKVLAPPLLQSYSLDFHITSTTSLIGLTSPFLTYVLHQIVVSVIIFRSHYSWKPGSFECKLNV